MLGWCWGVGGSGGQGDGGPKCCMVAYVVEGGEYYMGFLRAYFGECVGFVIAYNVCVGLDCKGWTLH